MVSEEVKQPPFCWKTHHVHPTKHQPTTPDEELPYNCKTIGGKWEFELKIKKADGSIERYKARRVAKG